MHRESEGNQLPCQKIGPNIYDEIFGLDFPKGINKVENSHLVLDQISRVRVTYFARIAQLRDDIEHNGFTVVFQKILMYLWSFRLRQQSPG